MNKLIWCKRDDGRAVPACPALEEIQKLRAGVTPEELPNLEGKLEPCFKCREFTGDHPKRISQPTAIGEAASQ